jgi:hypothetical protein
MRCVHALVFMAAAVAVLLVTAPAEASLSDGPLSYCINRAGCHVHLIEKRSEAWSGFRTSAVSRDFVYCMNRPSCHSRLIWKRSEAWNGVHASGRSTGRATQGSPWADIALGVGLACACFVTALGAMRVVRGRARPQMSRNG